ncbi:hypothetical protein HK405_007880 [Cladochytrium tenue]|nr:hypothetical protein HK405_007880 [Cladochytrium tenue]
MTQAQTTLGVLSRFLHQLRSASSAVDEDDVVEQALDSPPASVTLVAAARRAMLERHVRSLLDDFKTARGLTERVVPLLAGLSLGEDTTSGASDGDKVNDTQAMLVASCGAMGTREGDPVAVEDDTGDELEEDPDERAEEALVLLDWLFAA